MFGFVGNFDLGMDHEGYGRFAGVVKLLGRNYIELKEYGE